MDFSQLLSMGAVKLFPAEISQLANDLNAP
jgi:hypothetical protein